jgi:hypothetical protein
VFPMRYEINFYIIFRRNSDLKFLQNIQIPLIIIYNKHEYNIYMYMCIEMYALRTCYTKLFVVHQKYAHNQKLLKTNM